MFLRSTLLAAASVCFTAFSAIAAPVNFHADTTFLAGESDGEGLGRGLTFQADETFSISSIGLFFNLRALNFTVNIYDSTDGSDVISVINTSSADVGGFGVQNYDIDIAQTFIAGNFYGISWTPTVAQDWAESTPAESYYEDSNLPFDVGPATLLDGFEGNALANFAFGNTAHAAFRVDVVDPQVVPLPASLPLLIGAFGALGWASRRRNAG